MCLYFVKMEASMKPHEPSMGINEIQEEEHEEHLEPQWVPIRRPPPQVYQPPMYEPNRTEKPKNDFELFGTTNPWVVISIVFVVGFFLGKSMQTIVLKQG